jgi:site-specific DNA-methyltransferase (adenine-specific)
MIVLGGNMRLKACKEAGLKEVPIIKASNLTEQQQKEFIIKDNVGFGEWDWEELNNEWEAEELTEWGLDVLNFNTEILEAKEDDFDTTPPETPISVLGDLYEIGEHRLLCGDSTQTDTFEKLMDGKLADMCVTDPPYNVAYEGKTKDLLTMKNDSMGNDDFYKFLYDFYTALRTSVKKGGGYLCMACIN